MSRIGPGRDRGLCAGRLVGGVPGGEGTAAVLAGVLAADEPLPQGHEALGREVEHVLTPPRTEPRDPLGSRRDERFERTLRILVAELRVVEPRHHGTWIT